MGHYIYNGAVLIMGKIIIDNWKGETYAKSPRRAACNLCYQFKKQNGYCRTAKISLYGEPLKV